MHLIFKPYHLIMSTRNISIVISLLFALKGWACHQDLTLGNKIKIIFSITLLSLLLIRCQVSKY